MIVVETSALIAILFNEPEAERLLETIATAEGALIPASAYVEAGIVYGARHGATGLKKLDLLISELGASVGSFTPEHARAAVDAFLRFGKGRHPAGLNFGDCMSYAVAKVEGAEFVYVGTDFGATDVAGGVMNVPPDLPSRA